MSRIFWSLACLVGLSLAASPVPHQTNEDSLRSALNAVTRKQRSLDSLPQEYYNDLRSFKYHGEPERRFDREEIPEMVDDEDDLEFLPLERGQLENIGGGYQAFNNKRLERALIDYLETTPIQRDTGSSLFRERERTGARKRTLNSDRSTGGDRELARLFLDQVQNSPPCRDAADDTEYLPMEALQPMYDRHRLEQSNKFQSPGPMSWSELFAKDRSQDEDPMDFVDRDHGQRPPNYLLYQILPTQRRNVNGRFPIGREYRDLVKRFPVAKRSAKPFPDRSQDASMQNTKYSTTDPKVAQDLGALFGSQPSADNKTEPQKPTSKSTHVQSHNEDHNHMHGMDHMHQHTSERPASPKTEVSPTTSRQDLKEKSATTKERLIEVRKKSIDWSQYFGIDRRRKKATLLARPGTQDLDDEWLLQRYYKTMAENLKNPGKDFDRSSSDKSDKLDQMDEKLKNVKDFIVQDAVRYSTADSDADPQDVKDVVMSRLAAAYSLEKMRKALNEFRNSIASPKDLQRTAHTKSSNNSTHGTMENSSGARDNEKRSSNMIEEEGSPYEGFDEGKFTSCPELESIERSCTPVKNIVSGLFLPCVRHQVCRTCDDDDKCMSLFAVEAARVCDNLEEDDRDAGSYCARTALVISQMQPSPRGTSLCYTPRDVCMRRYVYLNRLEPHRHNTNSLDSPMKR